MLRLTLLILVLAPLCAGCGSAASNRQAIARQMTALTREMTEVLAAVHDKPSAEGAAPKVQALLDRSEKVNDALEAIEDEELDFGEDLDSAELREAVGQHVLLMQEIARISQIPEARDGLGQSWTDLTGGAYFLGVDQNTLPGAKGPPLP